MNDSMLAVDKDTEASKQDRIEWQKRGMRIVMVASMQAAIDELSKTSFLLTRIIADEINCWPLLKIMRDTAPTYIMIVDAKYSKEKEIKALNHGADLYTQKSPNVELNVRLGMAQLQRNQDRRMYTTVPPDMNMYDDFIVLSGVRQIYFHDEQLKLTKKEYDILRCLIEKRNTPVTYDELCRVAWGKSYDEIVFHRLWDYILKLRNKLRAVAGDKEYITNERNTGYRFSTHSDKRT